MLFRGDDPPDPPRRLPVGGGCSPVAFFCSLGGIFLWCFGLVWGFCGGVGVTGVVDLGKWGLTGVRTGKWGVRGEAGRTAE